VVLAVVVVAAAWSSGNYIAEEELVAVVAAAVEFGKEIQRRILTSLLARHQPDTMPRSREVGVDYGGPREEE
jgi:hypothetical protein